MLLTSRPTISTRTASPISPARCTRAAAGAGLILVSHDADFIAAACDRQVRLGGMMPTPFALFFGPLFDPLFIEPFFTGLAFALLLPLLGPTCACATRMAGGAGVCPDRRRRVAAGLACRAAADARRPAGWRWLPPR